MELIHSSLRLQDEEAYGTDEEGQRLDGGLEDQEEARSRACIHVRLRHIRRSLLLPPARSGFLSPAFELSIIPASLYFPGSSAGYHEAPALPRRPSCSAFQSRSHISHLAPRSFIHSNTHRVFKKKNITGPKRRQRQVDPTDSVPQSSNSQPTLRNVQRPPITHPPPPP